MALTLNLPLHARKATIHPFPSVLLQSLARMLLTLPKKVTKVPIISTMLLLSSIIKEYLCLLSLELPVEPVTAEDGRVYKRAHIAKHIENADDEYKNLRSPVTNEKMGPKLVPAVQVHPASQQPLDFALKPSKVPRYPESVCAISESVKYVIRHSKFCIKINRRVSATSTLARFRDAMMRCATRRRAKFRYLCPRDFLFLFFLFDRRSQHL